MLHTSLENIHHDITGTIYHAIDTNEAVSIATPKGAVVVIEQRDYEAMQETLRLLSDKKSLKALLDAHALRDNNQPLPSYSVEEVFSDLQD